MRVGFNCPVCVVRLTLRSERRAIDASNGLQCAKIYAFPEGSKDESATFVNTLKVFQSATFGDPRFDD